MLTLLLFQQAKRRRRTAFGLVAALLLLAVAIATTGPALAGEPEFRVIVHPGSGPGAADPDFVADIFLKKMTRWPNGESAKPVDLRPDSTVRRRFSETVLKRTVNAVRSYWQQRIFSGRDVPPPELESEDAVVAYVAKTPGAIGYVAGGTKLGGVKELPLH
jgi:ABC-type phosphate transport system substrate-binding protein